MVIANIQMESLFKLYHTVIVPAIVYSCETWIKCETDNSKLNQIQISALRRILKLPISTPLVSIYMETGILPLNLECEKRQLIYLWTLLNKKDQSNDIANMQLSEFSQNKNNLLNHITGLIKKFNIPTSHMDLQNISKGKWKSTVVKHIRKYANNHCVTKGKNLSKLKYLFKHKQEMMKEKYMSKLSRSEASTIFKLRTRMIHLKNNFRNIYKHDILCPRCKKEQDMEEHLFGKCEKLNDLYIKYDYWNMKKYLITTLLLKD